MLQLSPGERDAGMEYQVLSESLGRGGVEAVKSALEEFAGRASVKDLDAAVDMACRVIADDTARIEAHADRYAAQLHRRGASRTTARRSFERLWAIGTHRPRVR